MGRLGAFSSLDITLSAIAPLAGIGFRRGPGNKKGRQAASETRNDSTGETGHGQLGDFTCAGCFP